MSCFYELIPQDTLFFRGNMPMEAGQNTAASLFPPPVSGITGAVRSEIIRMNHVSFADYCAGRAPQLERIIGKAGGEVPFSITALLIKRRKNDGKNIYYMPSPAVWYVDSSTKLHTRAAYNGKTIIAAKLYPELFAALGVKSSEGVPAFVVPEHDAQPLKNIWLSVDFCFSTRSELKEDDVLLPSDIYARERRTGIGIDAGRKAEEGKLYTAEHIRFLPGISLVVCFDTMTALGEKGNLLLGGERRYCTYVKDAGCSLGCSGENAGQFVSLVPIPAAEELPDSLICSQKPEMISGWDLAKGFHKDSVNWIPAGAVFGKRIHKACYALPEKK